MKLTRSIIALMVCLPLACGDPDKPKPSGTAGEAGGNPGDDAGSGGDIASSGSGGTQAGSSAGGAAGGDDGPEDIEGTVRVALGTEFGCAINRQHTIECWGEPTADEGQTQPPPGAYVQVRASFATACAIKGDGAFDCWGRLAGAGVPVAGTDTLDVAVGSHACMLRSDGKIGCTGSVANGGIGLELGPFTGVGAGNGTSCGLKETGELLCWGMDTYGIVTDLPAGEFVQLATGNEHACAISKADASVVCWGAGDANDPNGNDPNFVAYGQAVPPAGKFTALAAGLGHSCGILEDGSVKCWGAGTIVENCPDTLECGQSAPPEGTFVQIACGTSNTCGIKDDGSLVCWGSNTSGRSTPPPDFRAF